MDDGKAMLYHWTKKIIVEDGHTVSQLVHLLNLIVKQYRVYYLWRQVSAGFYFNSLIF